MRSARPIRSWLSPHATRLAPRRLFALVEVLDQVGERHPPAVQKALGGFAPALAQEIGLGLAFDALRDHAQPHGARRGDDMADHLTGVALVAGFVLMTVLDTALN
jgi:hypothetical protein